MAANGYSASKWHQQHNGANGGVKSEMANLAKA
jgi:hypothetical protein